MWQRCGSATPKVCSRQTRTCDALFYSASVVYRKQFATDCSASRAICSINVLKIGALAAAMHPRLGQDSAAKSLSGDALKIIADFVTGCFTLARKFRKHADEMEVEST